MKDIFACGKQRLKRTARDVWSGRRGGARVWLITGFTLAVLVLLLALAREVNWREGFTTLVFLPAAVLWPAVGLVVLSYSIYSSFDLLARAYAGHRLNRALVLMVAGVSYAFNLNLGPLVGGVGFRYRLYTRLGLRAAIVTRILGFSCITNWLGYMWVAGIVFASDVLQIPADWPIDSGLLLGLGGLLLIAAAAYVALCTWARKPEFKLAGHGIKLPRGRMAVLQGVLGAASWAAMGLIIYVLFEQRIEYPIVLGTLMLAGLAGAMTHIPGGLGVLETVFVVLLAERASSGQVLGVLIAYRALYYLCPLLLAAAGYAVMELAAKTAGGQRGAQLAANPNIPKNRSLNSMG